ncbi:hypothetical protein NL676_011857 [Syzygium grande]|nr:hypothetical protein NL676_011857 [Syzygium grande]
MSITIYHRRHRRRRHHCLHRGLTRLSKSLALGLLYALRASPPLSPSTSHHLRLPLASLLLHRFPPTTALLTRVGNNGKNFTNEEEKGMMKRWELQDLEFLHFGITF